MNRFEIQATPLTDLSLLTRRVMGDDRGYLERLFCSSDLRSVVRDRTIVQINHTLTTRRGTVRGMHFQYPPRAEMKIVQCLRGEVFDVAVDLRRGSPTFLRWHGEKLSENNHRTLVIPEGFAHGFQTLTDNCEMVYFHTECYAPEAEAGLNPADPRLGIAWPEPITDISARDRGHAFIDADFRGAGA
jgi:dTDP-4-dehydrorhamnose 3,5-epimerase